LLTPGSYTLDVYKPGYHREIRQITVNKGDPVQTIDFQMLKAANIVYAGCLIDDDFS